MPGPLIQNFSIPADDDVFINIDVNPDDENFTLPGSRVVWRVFPQTNGVPISGSSPLITKTTDDGSIVILHSPLNSFSIDISRNDTVGLLRNYYHEARVIDGDGSEVTVTIGTMTITPTYGRDS